MQPEGDLSFFERLALAFRILGSGSLAAKARDAVSGPVAPVVEAPERRHASALTLLASFQREGRLVDFLQQEVTSFSDEEIGAAARVVHTGCRKVLQQSLNLEPAAAEGEGAAITLPKGFDAQKFRLTGNVSDEPPYKGTLRHHGWVTTQVRLPEVSEAVDPRVIAPAEVELA